MKRIIAVCVAVLVICIVTSSCAGHVGNVVGDVSDMVSDMADAGEKYSLRLGIYQDPNASEGKAKFSSTFAAIICDSNGKIVDCVFDAIEDNVVIEGGMVVQSGTSESKNEQGNAYSMRSASGIGKEWFEQAAHFADFIRGMKIEDAENVDGGEAELMAGCTIDINGFKSAIEEAEGNEEEAVTFECSEVPGVAVASVSNSDGSKDATAESDGIASLSSTYGAVAKNGQKIVAASIEVTETKVYFDSAGLVNQIDYGDGKREEGDSYGMKAMSVIGLEWYEQARNFEKYIVGMMPDQVAQIDMSEGYATDETLKAGCTIKIDDFVKVIGKTAQ